MSACTIEASIVAWLPTHAHISAHELTTSDPIKVIDSLGYSIHDMSTSGWVQVGVASIRIDIPDVDALLGQQIDAVKAARQQVLADAQMKAIEIDRQIQSLLAIEHQPAEPMVVDGGTARYAGRDDAMEAL